MQKKSNSHLRYAILLASIVALFASASIAQPLVRVAGLSGDVAELQQSFQAAVATERELRGRSDALAMRVQAAQELYVATISAEERLLARLIRDEAAAHAAYEEALERFSELDDEYQRLRPRLGRPETEASRAARRARDAADSAWGTAEARYNAARRARLSPPPLQNATRFLEWQTALAAHRILRGQLDAAEAEVSRTYLAYLAALSAGSAVPHLQEVTISLGDRRLYTGTWVPAATAIPAQGPLADALRETIARIESEISEISNVLREHRLHRAEALTRMQVAGLYINEAANTLWYTRQAEVLGPAIVDVLGVVLVRHYAGASLPSQIELRQLARRYGSDVAQVMQGGPSGAGTGLGKGIAGVVLERWGFDQSTVIHGAFPISDNGASAIVLGDLIELVVGSGVDAALQPSTWQPLSANQGWINYRQAFGSGVGPAAAITSVKAFVGYVARDLTNVTSQIFDDQMISYATAYAEYRLSLLSDRHLEEMRTQLYAQLAAAQYQLTVGQGELQLTRDIVPILQDEGRGIVRAALTFSQPLSQAPVVELEGSAMSVTGQNARWVAELPVPSFARTDTDTNRRLDLGVALREGSEPYATLDTDPSTRPVLDMGGAGWTAVEPGFDRHHYIRYDRSEWFSGYWRDQNGAVVEIYLEGEPPDDPGPDGVIYDYGADLLIPSAMWADRYENNERVFSFRSREGPRPMRSGEFFFRHRGGIQAGCGTGVIPVGSTVYYDGSRDVLEVYFNEDYISSPEDCAYTDRILRGNSWQRLDRFEIEALFPGIFDPAFRPLPSGE